MPSPVVSPKLLGAIAEMARGSDSRQRFRREATDHLARTFGFDCALWNPEPTIAWEASEMYAWGVSVEYVRGIRAHTSVVEELGLAVERSANRGAEVDAGVSRAQRTRSALWSEFCAPLRISSFIGLVIEARDRPRTLFSVWRAEHGCPFVDEDARALDTLSALISLGEDLCLEREGRTPAVKLTPRERDVAELVERGLTNDDIGRVLGISKNTVRNRLAAAFERTGSANRAELVARLRAR